MYVYVYLFKELDCKILVSGKYKICQAGQHAGIQVKISVAVLSLNSAEQQAENSGRISTSQLRQNCCSFRTPPVLAPKLQLIRQGPHTLWHIIRFTQSLLFGEIIFDLEKNTFKETGLVFNQTTGLCNLAKISHKINHHTQK